MPVVQWLARAWGRAGVRVSGRGEMEPSVAFATRDFAEPSSAPPRSELAEAAPKSASLHEDWGLFSFFQITCCGKSFGPRRTKQLLGCLCAAVLVLLVAPDHGDKAATAIDVERGAR